MKKKLLILILFVISSITFAQTPEKVSYQAVLRDVNNALVVNQQVGMQISILKGDVAVYVEEQKPKSNSNGLVSLEIGLGSVIQGVFSDIDWSNGKYYIKTEIDPEGGNSYKIIATSQILSVPFALHAKTAENGISEEQSDAINVNSDKYTRAQIDSIIKSKYTVKLDSIEKINNKLDSIVSDLYVKINNINSTLGKEGKTHSQEILADRNIIKLMDFPYHLKKGLSMSFYANLTLKGSVSYGKGFGRYRGEYLTIDDKNIYYYYNRILQSAKPHGLSIDKYLRSSFFVDDSSVAHVILQSLGGTFQTTFKFRSEMNFEPFIKTEGQEIKNIKLSCTSKEFQHPVWAFGDSYFGVSPNRWVGVMKNFGYFNFMINGLAGQGSNAAFADLERSLNYGTPKYLLWFLGMNDSSYNYRLNLDKVIDKCNDLGITLILATIPTVPSRDKEGIRSKVLESGFRYVDFYKAVGADNKGIWYSNYLDSDGVHPTVIGAQALAGQVLFDFPELMQYGKTF